MKRFFCAFNASQQSGRGKIWHTKFKIYIKVSYEAWITFSDMSSRCSKQQQKKLTTTIPCPVSGDERPVWVKKKLTQVTCRENKKRQSNFCIIYIFCIEILPAYLISSQKFSFKNIAKFKNTENGYSNGLLTNVQVMTSFLTHHQRPTDYTIGRQQRHNGTKNINIIVSLQLKHFSCTAKTKYKQNMTLQRQLNRCFLPPFFSNLVEPFDVALQHSLRQTGN